MCRLFALAFLPALLAGCPSRPKAPGEQGPAAAMGPAQLTTVLSTRLQPGGVEVRNKKDAWAALGVGESVPIGAVLRTRTGVQALLALKSGALLHLNERSELRLAGERRVILAAGELLAEVSQASSSDPVEIETGSSLIRVTGTKLNVRLEKDTTLVDVARGTVEVSSRGGGSRLEVGAGERALVKAGASPRLSLSQDLAETTRWARELGPRPGQPESLQPGIGSLEARVPGQGKSFALRLARQEVRVLVHDNVARTEVEQEYYNGSAQTLEGTYRFPLPAGASISRLALYVGNRLEEGEIVERQRARQIFRQIVEDTVRPRDPALLEWVGGRTFQMKIFPIPPRASRKVILGYTQVLPASYGRYRYEYPMASDPGKATTVGHFLVELRATSGRGLPEVQTPLYPTTAEKDNEAVRLRYEARDFRPAASFVATMRPAAQPPELQLALFEPEPGKAPARCAAEPPVSPAARRGRAPAVTPAACGDRGGFFMAVLRPELPSQGRPKARDYLFVLDSSYSSGKRGWGLQLAALETLLGEMDLRSRFNLMVCDVSCRTGGSFEKPTSAARQAALKLARSITPGGSSNLQLAFEEAGQLLMRAGVRGAQVIYLGDGRPSAGELREPQLARRLVAALQASQARFSAIQVGDDASELLLPEATRRLGGSVHRLGPGDDVAGLVLDVVAAQYRPTLSELELSFEGLDVHHVYPSRLPSLTAGSEAVLVGRYGRGGQGALLVRGKLDGQPFERRFPVRLAAEQGERLSNRFVPRLWAQHHLEALTVEDYNRNRPEIVRVSKAYTVLSRATAFLVLENERMYREFGVRRTRHQNDFKAGKVVVRDSKDQPQAAPLAQARGETARSAQAEASAPVAGGGRVGLAGAPAASAAPAEEAPRAHAGGAGDDLDDVSTGSERAGAEKEEASKPAPKAKRAAEPPARPPRMARPLSDVPEPRPVTVLRRVGRHRPRRPETLVTIQPLPSAPTQEGLRLEDDLRQQVARNPLRRGLHAAYHRVLMRNGSLDEALRHATEWVELDGSNAASLAALADVQALQTGLPVALRTRASTVDVEPWNPRWHQQLADAYRHKGQPRLSCAHLWSLVSLAPRRPERYLALVQCLSALPDGRAAAISLLTDDLPDGLTAAQGARLLAALRELRAGVAPAPAPVSRPAGPLLLSASWDGPADLDIVLTTPSGERISSLSRGRAGGVEIDSHDGRTPAAELLRLRWLADGEYRVEVVRLAEGASKSSSSLTGTLHIRAAGRTSVIPFVLTSAARSLARIRVARAYRMY